MELRMIPRLWSRMQHQQDVLLVVTGAIKVKYLSTDALKPHTEERNDKWCDLQHRRKMLKLVVQ